MERDLTPKINSNYNQNCSNLQKYCNCQVIHCETCHEQNNNFFKGIPYAMPITIQSIPEQQFYIINHHQLANHSQLQKFEIIVNDAIQSSNLILNDSVSTTNYENSENQILNTKRGMNQLNCCNKKSLNGACKCKKVNSLLENQEYGNKSEIDDHGISSENRITIKKKSSNKIQDPLNVYGKAMTGNTGANFNSQAHFYKSMIQMHERYQNKIHKLREDPNYKSNYNTSIISESINDDDDGDNDDDDNYIPHPNSTYNDYCANIVEPRNIRSLSSEENCTIGVSGMNNYFSSENRDENTNLIDHNIEHEILNIDNNYLKLKTNKSNSFIANNDDCLEYFNYQKLKNLRKQKRDQLVENQKNEIRNQLLKEIYSPRSKNLVKINHENMGNNSYVTQINSINSSNHNFARETQNSNTSTSEFGRKLNPNAPPFVSQTSQNNFNSSSGIGIMVAGEQQANDFSYPSEYIMTSDIIQNNDSYEHLGKNNGLQQGDYRFNFLQPDLELIPRSHCIPENVVEVNYFEILPTNSKQKDNFDQIEKVFVENVEKPYEDSSNKVEKVDTSKDSIIEDLRKFIKLLQNKNPYLTMKDIQDILENIPKISSDNEKSTYDFISKKICEIDSIKSCSPFHSSTVNCLKNFVSHICRARYIPTKKLLDEPLQQYEMIYSTNYENLSPSYEIKSATNIGLDRQPLTCPISLCNQRKIFISEFAKHIKVDHLRILIETITPGKFRNLFLDTKAIQENITKCLGLYLVTNKVKNLGNHEFKDFLPVTVMTSKIQIRKLLNSRQKSCSITKKNSKYFTMIWITGLTTIDLPIFYTLVIWSNAGKIPINHLVQSGQLHSIREDQTAENIFKTGNGIILTPEQCDAITNNGKNMINVQVSIQ